MPLVYGDEMTVPYMKFNAKDKKWFVNTKTGDVHEIDPPKLLMELEGLQTGWLRFREAQAPDMVFDPPRAVAAEPDGGNHKRGFRLSVYTKSYGAREMASNSLMLKRAVKEVYNTWEKHKDQHPGKLPLVEITDHVGVQGQYGINYKPEFAIAGWYTRPEDFHVRETNNAGSASATQAPTPVVVDDPNDEVPF